tara:strand:- start:2284 stop:2931 length:648 start_codon:yes stop_codon:yes gene_type:complete
MDRRKALKTIGYGAGAITLFPAVVGLFHSCQNNSSNFVPEYFNKNQFAIVSQLMELILPETEIPGAINLKLPEFLDGYIQTIYSDEGKNKISKGLDSFIDVALFDSEKSKANKLTNEDLDFQLAKYLKTDNDQKKSWKKQDYDYQKALKNKSNSPELPQEALAYGFADQLRSLSITAFKTNEYIGENVLAYAPIPGEQRGCVDLMETTGGKIWSL